MDRINSDFHILEEDTIFHGSNCIFDGTSERSDTSCSEISLISPQKVEEHGDVILLQRQNSVASVTDHNRRKWIIPTLVISLSLACLLMSVGCFIGQFVIFSYCGETLLTSGACLPILFVLVSICMNQPGRRYLLQDDFFSDALLEEMLSGENILDVYTVATRGMTRGNVIVFLSGVGGVTETWREQVEAVVQAGFSAITIQLPGSGTLGAVRFSLRRAERVVRRVLEVEMFSATVDSVSDDGNYDDHIASCGNKVLIVTWGIASHVALYLASSQRLGNDKIAGLVILGSPYLPKISSSWQLYFRCAAFRVEWIAEVARFTERAFMHSETRHAISFDSINPSARADWYDSFQLRKEALRIACAEFVGPVLCVSGSKQYLEAFKEYFQNSPDESFEGIYVKRLGNAGLSTYPYNHGQLFSTHIVDFASSIYI